MHFPRVLSGCLGPAPAGICCSGLVQKSPEALGSVLTLQEDVLICLGFSMLSFSPG